jgi:hypothetical protein
VAQPKKKGKQLELGTEWTDDRRRENDYINEVRAAVGDWRRRDYPGVTRTTRRLLESVCRRFSAPTGLTSYVVKASLR